MDEFNTRSSQRKAIRTKITKNITHLQNAINDPTPCVHSIKVVEEKLNKTLNELNEVDEYIWAFIGHHNEDATVKAEEREREREREIEERNRRGRREEEEREGTKESIEPETMGIGDRPSTKWKPGDKEITSTNQYTYLGDIISADGGDAKNLEQAITRKVLASSQMDVL